VYSDILHKDQAVCFLAPIDKFIYCENSNRISKQLIESNIFLVLSFVSYDKMKLFTVAVILCLQADGLLGEVCEDDEANYQKASDHLIGVGRINGPADCKALAQKNPNGEGECGSDHIVGKYCRKSCGTCEGVIDCDDPNNRAKDFRGLNCDWVGYNDKWHSSCGKYDDNDFKASIMCCDCKTFEDKYIDVIDQCASNPCKNDGTCEDGKNSYTCTCVNNWSGYNCETECIEDTHCDSSRPFCTSTGHCGECKEDSDCSNDERCFIGTCERTILEFLKITDMFKTYENPCPAKNSLINYSFSHLRYCNRNGL